jgi:elongation factor G
MDAIGNGARVIALVGPAGAGKTSLAEALLEAAGAIPRLGSVEAGTTVGDSSPEARARGGSTELNLMHFDYLDDSFALVDAPGAIGCCSEALPWR